ncbi:MAG TPA: CoA transferase [Ramlibacter sp.]|nr:CoA transferase [Ramlibacter sp.]
MSKTDSFAPLTGVRVLDFSKVLAGPLCTQYLADLGADVVKVEHVEGGDDTRHWPPFVDGTGSVFLSANRNKRSIALDLKSDEGRLVCHRLAASADVVVESFGPGVAERLQVDAATLEAHNPRLVHCSISGFGATGPLRNGKGYDLVLQAYTGMLSMTGDAGTPPARSPFSPVDQGTGLHALSGILAGLLQRDRTGRGVRVEANLFDTATGFLGYLLQGYWQRGTEPLRVGSGHESLCPYQSFETQDRPLILGVANDALWRSFCAVAGATELASREDLATNAQRVHKRAEVMGLVQTVLARRTRAEWMKALQDAGVPCAPVHSLGEFAQDDHLEASGMVFDYPAGEGAAMRGVAQPLRFDGQRAGARRRAPGLGADTAQILAEAGFDAAAIDSLFTRGVVAAPSL